uniref:TOD1/MUCI70 glycosyltransferase-like domain-containing protein n=1 Tax=Leersia perrieri TaxID=77586 RepID=A0A0D9WIZ0_9ORYZ
MSGSVAGSLGLRSGSYGSLPSVGGGAGGGRTAAGAGPGCCCSSPLPPPPSSAPSSPSSKVEYASIDQILMHTNGLNDDNASMLIANNYEVVNTIQNSVYPSMMRPLVTSSDQYSASSVNKIELPNRLRLSFANFTHHPCEGFSVAPPLVDPKRTGPRPCAVCYVSVDQAFALMPLQPSPSPVLKNLSYAFEDVTANFSNQGSVFGGHPSLEQRNKSFDINESMTVHCGFVRGKKPGQGSGFDINDDDLLEMEQCHEETEAHVKNSTSLYRNNKIGLWRLVVVRNLPYEDPRRTGKIPKLLLHRLFPNVRFSVWIDAKLKLVVDPYLLLERNAMILIFDGCIESDCNLSSTRFLWRKNATFAISRHYKRFDVFEEAEANKAAGKYDNTSIDYQIDFYRNEGLTHYSPAKLPITSDVPEGCVIIREHIPITNLFTCLWFNEVDRFTSRDQISFSTVRDKIRAKVGWMPQMFLDCERRNFVLQAYHRELLEQMIASGWKPPSVASEPSRKLRLGRRKTPSKKPSMKRKRVKKSSLWRRLPKPITGMTDGTV